MMISKIRKTVIVPIFCIISACSTVQQNQKDYLVYPNKEYSEFVKPIHTSQWDYYIKSKTIYYNPECRKIKNAQDVPITSITYSNDVTSYVQFSKKWPYTSNWVVTCNVTAKAIIGHHAYFETGTAKKISDVANVSGTCDVAQQQSLKLIMKNDVLEGYKVYQSEICLPPMPEDLALDVKDGTIVKNHQLMQDPTRPGIFTFVGKDGTVHFPCRFFAELPGTKNKTKQKLMYATGVPDTWISYGMMCRINENNDWKVMDSIPYTYPSMDAKLNKMYVGYFKIGNFIYDHVSQLELLNPFPFYYNTPNGPIPLGDVVTKSVHDAEYQDYTSRYPIHNRYPEYQQYHEDEPFNENQVHDLSWYYHCDTDNQSDCQATSVTDLWRD